VLASSCCNESTVVTRVGRYVISVHHKHASSGDSCSIAQVSLNAQAQSRARLFAACTSFNDTTAHLELVLKASVFGHVIVNRLATQAELRDSAINRQELAGEPAA